MRTICIDVHDEDLFRGFMIDQAFSILKQCHENFNVENCEDFVRCSNALLLLAHEVSNGTKV